MANNFDLKIEWPTIDVLVGFFKTMDDRFIRIALEEMDKFGFTVEETAKKLAPRDSGNLEDDIHSEGSALRGAIIEVVVGTSVEYALRMHEQPERSGTHDKYERGEKLPGYYKDGRGYNTRKKPSVNGYQPGRKYLTNAILANEEAFEKMCTTIITRVLEAN